MDFAEWLLDRRERGCVYWWKPRAGGPNVGDDLARVIVAAILRLADRRILDKRNRRARLFSIGSVLHFARDGETVWGTGANGKVPESAYGFANLDVRAVRGPLTQALLKRRGVSCPSVFGDPGLLAPRFFPPELVAERIGTHEFLVVPHLNDPPEPYRRFGDRLCSPRQYPAAFIRSLLRARRVVSASLHGIVLAEAYGISAVLLDAGGTEPRFKYDDYYRGTGRSAYPVAHSVDEALSFEAPSPPRLDAVAGRLLRAFPYDLWGAEAVRRTSSHVAAGNETARA